MKINEYGNIYIMNCNSSNGRIDILGPNPMELFDKIPVNKNNNRKKYLSGQYG